VDRVAKRAVLASLVAGAAAALLPAASGARAVHVEFRHYSPLAVSGSGFAPAQRVRISVSWHGGRVARRIRADARGRISASWHISVRRHLCDGLVAVVVTGSGRRATARPPAALCGAVPLPTPPPD